jgi:Streptomyces sporulation and cell division protein, SsgA
MMDSGTTVSAELGFLIVIPRQVSVPVTARLCYTGDDPYAVRVAFHSGTDEAVEWIFARDLLAAGLTEPAGAGDVRAWPSPAGDGGGAPVLNIILSSPFGEAHFEAPMTAMAEFLRRTYNAIPAGRESDFFDIGAELDSLLWRA